MYCTYSCCSNKSSLVLLVVDRSELAHQAAYAGDVEVLRSSLLHNPGRVSLPYAL